MSKANKSTTWSHPTLLSESVCEQLRDKARYQSAEDTLPSILKFIQTYDDRTVFSKFVIAACATGDLGLLLRLERTMGKDFRESTDTLFDGLRAACARKQYDVAQYLIANYIQPHYSFMSKLIISMIQFGNDDAEFAEWIIDAAIALFVEETGGWYDRKTRKPIEFDNERSIVCMLADVLPFAAQQGMHNITEMLIRRKVPVSTDALSSAINCGNLESVKIMLGAAVKQKRGMKPEWRESWMYKNYTRADGYGFVCQALSCNKPDIYEYLLEKIPPIIKDGGAHLLAAAMENGQKWAMHAVMPQCSIKVLFNECCAVSEDGPRNENESSEHYAFLKAIGTAPVPSEIWRMLLLNDQLPERVRAIIAARLKKVGYRRKKDGVSTAAIVDGAQV